MKQATAEVGPITVTDLTGQKKVTVGSMPSDATIDEVVQRLLGPLHVPGQDAEGRALSYAAKSEREGRFLGGNERLGDAVQPNDTLRLMPSIDAGRF